MLYQVSYRTISQEPESNQRHAETCYSLLKNYNPPLYQLSYPEPAGLSRTRTGVVRIRTSRTNHLYEETAYEYESSSVNVYWSRIT